MLNLKSPRFDALKQAKRNFFRHNDLTYAASIAYHATLSLAPLLLIATALISGFVDPVTVSSFVVTAVRKLFGAGFASFVQEMILTNAGWQPQNIITTIAAAAFAIYTSTNVFRQLTIALNNVWDVEYEQLTFRADPVYWLKVRSRRYLLGLLFAIGTVVIVWGSLLVTLLVGYLDQLLPVHLLELRPIISLVNIIASAAFWIILTVSSFKLLPNHGLGWREISKGALLTGIVLALGQGAIGVFVGRSRIPSLYGVAGSLLVILLWIYYASIILLFGAELTRIIAEGESEQANVQVKRELE